MRWLFLFVALRVPACVLTPITAGADSVSTRLLAAPLPRAREVIADAMQAAGVLIFRETEERVEGERTVERIKALGVPAGDEAVVASLAAVARDGRAETQVRVETLRRNDKNNKKGAPKRVWSTAILDEAACLISLLSLDDPLHRPRVTTVGGRELQVADGTSVPVRSRRFFFSTEAKPNQIILFETAGDVIMNGSVVIAAGLPAVASIENASDIKELGGAAKAQIRFRYLVLPDGKRVPLRGSVDLRGKGHNKALLIAGAVTVDGSLATKTGLGFAIPAGTLFHTEVDGSQDVGESSSRGAVK
ncbi:MAG: hypothetical protein JO022_21875 [Acidobacteriaceae bacterium]|nr:hypothetical protein [Acidobacteriaceae bacterium]